jgi:hypothetical protein
VGSAESGETMGDGELCLLETVTSRHLFRYLGVCIRWTYVPSSTKRCPSAATSAILAVCRRRRNCELLSCALGTCVTLRRYSQPKFLVAPELREPVIGRGQGLPSSCPHEAHTYLMITVVLSARRDDRGCARMVSGLGTFCVLRSGTVLGDGGVSMSVRAAE